MGVLEPLKNQSESWKSSEKALEICSEKVHEPWVYVSAINGICVIRLGIGMFLAFKVVKLKASLQMLLSNLN